MKKDTTFHIRLVSVYNNHQNLLEQPSFISLLVACYIYQHNAVLTVELVVKLIKSHHAYLHHTPAQVVIT